MLRFFPFIFLIAAELRNSDYELYLIFRPYIYIYQPYITAEGRNKTRAEVGCSGRK